MNILWIEDFGQLDSGVNTLTLMFQNLLSFDNINKDSLNLIDYPNQLAEFCQQQASVHCLYLCRNYFDYVDFKNNHAIVNKIDAIILDIRLNNGDHVDFNLGIPEPYSNTAEFHKNAGFYIFNDLIHLGFPAEKMCFMTGEDSTFGDFKTKCLEIYVPQMECFEKRDKKGYDNLRVWLQGQESDYVKLRRGIIEGCRDISKDLSKESLNFNGFIASESKKQVTLEDMRDYLSVLENFLPLREPSTADKAVLYKLFIRTLTHEWEATDPKKIKGLAWIMKSTRNWITHNSILFSTLDEQIVSYLFMLNMRIMFNFDTVKKPYEEILFKLFSGEDLTKEVFEEQNKNKLMAIKIKKVYCDLQNKVSGENIKDAFRFPALANNIQESNSELRKDQVLFAKLLYQMFWLINSYPRVEVRMGKVEITFDEFDYRKKPPYLFELARHIYNRSFS